MQNSHEVTIIGAGPTGLLAAIDLVKNGIRTRIFESKARRSKLSRALAIHAGTLEYLAATHPELLKKLLARGKKIRHLKVGKKYQLDIGIIPSKFNFILLLEQEETEKILEEHLECLGCRVEKSCQLINARNFFDHVIVTIRRSDEIIVASSNYLLDCIGAHSVIRKDVLRLPFYGEKYFGRLVMGDVKINSKLAPNCGQTFGNNNGFAAFVPLNEPNFFRVILVPHIAVKIPEKISIKFFKNLAKKIAPEIKISDESKWLTSFEISKRLVKKMRVGRIFLLGDAAHIHSPVGGQGMNLGMQDALNITDKLARVLINGESERLLKKYEKQRMPIIKKVLRMTNFAMKSGFEKSFSSAIGFWMIKNIAAPIFFRSKFLQKKLCIKISQIESARKEISWRE